ncbi:MAG: dihydrolipoyl dehydrogenase [Tepidanaerobacteraceae bacterium]|nr:dihydrolipoyl dehydrogenase [Tepidanaerobacteraceae bacterium]
MLYEVVSPKQGTIFNVNVKVGDVVKPDDELAALEAKKEVSIVTAECSGKIEEILVSEGMEVNVQDVLFKIKSDNQEAVANSEHTNADVAILESDITIIGGGPAGYIAAIKAAKLGAKVVLVEENVLGGTCLNWGCIPTKAIVRSAEVYNEMKEASKYGLNANGINFDMSEIIERKNIIVKRLVNGIEYLMDKNNVNIISGQGRFIDKNTIEVITKNKKTLIHSKNIIIATGSETVSLPIAGADSKNVLTSKEMLDKKDLPKKLAIIGGGVIGMEFAFAFASFGVKVAVIEYMDSVLPMLDNDLIKEITRKAKSKGIKLYTSSEVKEIVDTEDSESIVKFIFKGTPKYIAVDKVLMSVGRKPYFKDLNLEEVGVEISNETRGIQVNDKMQTNIDNIYAIGDVTNKIQLAHVASHQGIVAVENILGTNHKMDYSAIPSAIFTHPEIASVGLSEKDARKQDINIEISKFPYAANGKALAMGEEDGFIKIIKEKDSKKIIGASIIGFNAADLLATLTVAIKNNLTSEEIAKTVFAHPTTAEIIHEGVLAFEGGAFHIA